MSYEIWRLSEYALAKRQSIGAEPILVLDDFCEFVQRMAPVLEPVLGGEGWHLTRQWAQEAVREAWQDMGRTDEYRMSDDTLTALHEGWEPDVTYLAIAVQLDREHEGLAEAMRQAFEETFGMGRPVAGRNDGTMANGTDSPSLLANVGKERHAMLSPEHADAEGIVNELGGGEQSWREWTGMGDAEPLVDNDEDDFAYGLLEITPYDWEDLSCHSGDGLAVLESLFLVAQAVRRSRKDMQVEFGLGDGMSMTAFASELYAIPGGIVRRVTDNLASEVAVIPFSKVTSICFAEPSSPSGAPKYDWRSR